MTEEGGESYEGAAAVGGSCGGGLSESGSSKTGVSDRVSGVEVERVRKDGVEPKNRSSNHRFHG